MNNPFDQSYNWFNQAGQTAANAISPESRDRAAARLRASLDVAKRRDMETVGNQEAARGSMNSGRLDKRRGSVYDSYYQSLSKGLGENENNFLTQSLNASNAMQGAGSGMAGAAAAQGGVRNSAIQNFIQGGNVFADPYGDAAKNFWGQAGLDISGLNFFGAPGTTNPIGVPGGGGTTNVNVGTGSAPGGGVTGGGPTLGDGGLNSSAPIEAQAESILSSYRLGTPVVMSEDFVSSPLGNYVYNRLIALTGGKVRIVPGTQYKSNSPFQEDYSGFRPSGY